ncbi:cytochrome c oxidase assembly protein [Terriglobus sp.]|uniref:cytochrome c oxidase assembly protein n=1 Tax=Terriglobus sp. TaxID=1889013 RepID=UPI003B00F793
MASGQLPRGLAHARVRLTSPIHELGEQLFSAHMLQHEILILIAASLISASHLGATCLWALAPRHRTGVGGCVHTVERSTPVRFFMRPLTAWLLEAATLWIWQTLRWPAPRSNSGGCDCEIRARRNQAANCRNAAQGDARLGAR